MSPESPDHNPQISILTHPLDLNQENVPPPNYRPQIPISLFDNEQTALLDSGASVSAISEDLFQILNINPNQHKIPLFPLTNILLTTALSNKTVKIKSQIYLTFSIKNYETHGIFLIVPQLSTPLILGTDWLLENGVTIDYNKKEISIITVKDKIPFCLITDHDPNSFVNALKTIDFSEDSPYMHEHPSNRVYESLPFATENNIALNDIPLTTHQQNLMISLIQKHQPIFQDKPGLHHFFSYKFNVKPHEPYKIKPYPVPFSRRPAVQKEIDRMIQWGVIERSDSPYNNPLVTVIKTDGSIRLCLDARKLNTIILPTRDASPPIDDILAKFNDKCFFSSLDFSSGYWQIPLDPEVRQYTSFLYDGRSYQFCVVPFGLNISNAAFGKGLEAALNNYSQQCPFPNDIHTYVDDILLSSSSFENHIITLEWIFHKISLAGLTLKLTKCHFNKQQIKFLGHFISPQGTVMDPDKVKALQNFPEPRNKKDLQSFFGFCNFYRKFSQNHSSLLHPLSHLIHKDTPWNFTAQNKIDFQKIKTAFSLQISLTHPNFNIPFCIQTDASYIGLGAELFQIDKNGQRNTLSFASRSLCGAERNYTVTELELLGILFACQKFKIYILGYPINLYTDHKALTFLFSCKLKNSRLTRWTLALQEFDLKIYHCAGKDNPIDTLSRHPPGRDEQPPKDTPIILHYTLPPPIPPDIATLFKNISYEQQKDPKLFKIISLLKANPVPVWQKFYLIKNETLFIQKYKNESQWSIYLPSHLVQQVITFFHDYYAHIGPLKTAQALRSICHFPSFNKTVRLIVQACDICQKCKPKTTHIAGPMQSILSNKPLDKLLVDFYGPLPVGVFQFSYIFVVVDNFTRFIKLYPLRRANAKICIKKLTTDYFPNFGVPKNIVSDHGRQFISKHWQTSLRKYNINVSHTSVYHPQSNPAERVMRELGRMFRTYCHQQHSTWPQYVPYIEWTLNNVRHESTHQTPSALFLNKSKYNPLVQCIQFPNNDLPLDYNKELTLAQDVQVSKAEARKKAQATRLNPTLFKVGDMVLVRTHKLSNLVEKKISKFFLLYDGPFKITNIKTTNAYELAHPDDGTPKGTHNIIHLKPYIPPTQ